MEGEWTVEERAKRMAELLKALANESRLLIFCCLMERPMTVGEIARCVPRITQPALSQHLAMLRARGILDSDKSGQSVTYRVADRRVEEVVRVLRKFYCEDSVIEDSVIKDSVINEAVVNESIIKGD